MEPESGFRNMTSNCDCSTRIIYVCFSELFLKMINKPTLKNEHITGDLVQITFVTNVLKYSENMLLVCL